MSYFLYLNINKLSKTKKFIHRRKKRPSIKGLKRTYCFTAGDIINVVYFKKALGFTFEGICLAVRKLSFSLPNTSFLLRNVILSVGMEFISSFFYNRNYYLTLLDYKRKAFYYKSTKLYFLRNRINRNTKV